jgi:hypothetical protein
MRTTNFLLAAGVSLVLAFTFSSCGDGDGGFWQSAPGGSGILQGLTFKSGNIPSGNAVLLGNVQMNDVFISGGSTEFTFTSPEQLDELYIQIGGESGYYVIDLNDCECMTHSESGYTDTPTIQFSQDMASNNEVRVTLSGVSRNGETSVPVERTVITKQVGSGSLQISLSWNNADDLDLYVKTPSGGTISWGNPTAGNGNLDLDANAACGNNVRNENIFFEEPLANGDYTVWIQVWGKCGTTQGAAYNVSAHFKGQFIKSWAATAPSYANDDYKIELGIITVNNGTATVR